ncbi:MAG: hypothetical protein A3E87_04820 [Gammaproteobacteria bacterium RIFCSPHIGHO2_12_FULL_35_23]|nr:MAG: hypothetical protein A3E87_04820 [Gammaproteobacteria bacterium RIFCSPHIGHO2_12_FULL_35_23]
MLSHSPKNIAILGAGAAGTALFINLIDHIIQIGNSTNFKITVIEKTGIFGPGLAYSTQLDNNLLNTPAFDLGIIHGYKTHFWSWVVENESLWQAHCQKPIFYERNTPLPRKLYGFYLQTMFHNAKKKAAKAGILIKLMADEAVDIIKNQQGYNLYFKINPPQDFDIICCCLGLGKKTRYPHLSQQSNYFAFPGEDELHFSTIPKTAKVAILGARLSAIDSILLLAKNKHNGEIYSISRTATMPNVISKHVKYPRHYLNKSYLLALTKNGENFLTLKQLAMLIKKEYRYYEKKNLKLKSLLIANKKPIVKFRYDIIKVNNKIRSWQAALYATNDVVNLIWRLLAPEAKQVIGKYYMRLFQSQRIAMPLCNAKKIYQLYRNKKLSFHNDHAHIEHANNKFFITMRNKNLSISVDYLIDAAGLTQSIAESSNQFIKNLVSYGLATPDQFDFISINPDTMQAINNKSLSENIYVLGGLTQGTYIASNLMESIVELSQNIIRNIIQT